MPTYIRSKINTDLPVEITLNSEGSETILNQDGTFRLPGVGSNGIGSLRVIDRRVEVKLSTGEWKQIIVSPDLAAVALSGLFSDLVSTPTTISGYGITDAYTKTQVDTGISTAINNLVDGAPDLLNTLNELSQALNNDAGFAGTITSSLSQKLDKSGGVMTGLLTLSANPTNSLHAATKQYVDTYVNDATASVAIDTYTTDNLEEGITNKYFSNDLARAAISVTGSGSYNSSTGVITVTGGVTSVNNKDGAVTLSTTDIAEGTNKYYTDARARTAISVIGSGSYNNQTGEITVTGGVTSVNNKDGAVTINTDDVNEGQTNKYFSNALARNAISAGTGITVTDGVIATTITQYTDAMARSAISVGGSLNYNNGVITNTITQYTDVMARGAISVSGSLSYNSSTGVISYSTPNTDAVSEGTANRYFTPERVRLSVSAGSGISYSSDTGIIAVNTSVIATKNDLTTTNVTEGTNLYYTIDRTKNDGFATKAYLDGQLAQVSLNVINTIDNVNAFMKTTAITTAALVTLVDSITAPSFAQSDWNETDPNKLDYIRNKPNLSSTARSAISVSGSLSYNSSTGVISYTTPSTSGIAEGTNLYFTNNRARAALRAGTGISYDNSTGVITNAITQYTDTMAKAVISATGDLSYNSSTGVISYTTPSTSGIAEGTNLYFTNNRARAAVSAGVGIHYNNSTGVITNTITQYTDAMARNAISVGGGLNYDSITGEMSLSSSATMTLSPTAIVDGGNITFLGSGTGGESSGSGTGSNSGGLTAQVQSDWTATTGLAQILNKPTLSIVATSGRYDDLIGSPLPYDLPVGTTTRLGGVKVDGTSIISTNGVLSVSSTLNGSLTGNASTASKLATARTINGVSFDGSANITVKATATNALTIGTGLSGTSYDGSSAVTITNTGVTSIAGTANQITASASTGGITLSLPNALITPGSLTVTGNLTVNGTTTTINSTVLAVNDLNIEVAKNATTAAEANNAGLIVAGANAALLYTSANDRWNLNKSLNVPSVYSDLIGDIYASNGTSRILNNGTNGTDAVFTGDVIGNVTGNVTGSAGSVAWANVSGKPTLVTSATTDTTNAANITSGTLSNSRLSSIPNSALANSSITLNGQSVSLGGNLSISAQSPNALTIGTGLSGTSYNGSSAVTITNTGVTSIAGTANQITASASTGGITLSLPSSLITPGSLTVTGNLTVNGTTTTINSTVLAVDDLNIEIAKNATTAAEANNAGLIVAGSNAALLYTSADDRWNLNKGLNVSRVFGSLTGNVTGNVTGSAGTVTSISGNTLTSSQITAGLGFTPYNSSNPGGYTNNTGTVTSVIAGSYLTGGTITTSGILSVDATSANTANKVVVRDGGGNFIAGTITAGLNGNASTATTLQTARAINGVSFNGSADITVHSAGTGIGISGTTVTNLLATSGGAIGGAITVSGSITATGEITAYFSDARLKTNVEPIIDPISKVMNLRGVTFRPNQTALDLGITDREEVGVIAQEVEAVLPQLVVESGYEGYKTVKYDKLTALLIEAVKNQQVQIDELKQEIKRLKNG